MVEVKERLKVIEELLTEQNLLRKEVLTVNEAAVYMDLSKPTLYKLTSKNKIPFYKPTMGKIYFRREELKSYMLSGRQSTEQELSDNAVQFLTKRGRAV